MGLTTIDPHNQKQNTEFGINQTAIQRFKKVKINKEMYGHPDAVFERLMFLYRHKIWKKYQENGISYRGYADQQESQETGKNHFSRICKCK